MLDIQATPVPFFLNHVSRDIQHIVSRFAFYGEDDAICLTISYLFGQFTQMTA